MPREHNPPPWYTPRYQVLMEAVIHEIASRFPPAEVDHAFIQELHSLGQPEFSSLARILVSGKDLIWWGPQRNIGWIHIQISNPSFFKKVLPSYMVQSVYVPARYPSASEETDMAELLAARLSPDRFSGDPQELQGLLSGYSPEQLQTIRSVLDLMALRNDEAGRLARKAISDFWSQYASIVPIRPDATDTR